MKTGTANLDMKDRALEKERVFETDSDKLRRDLAQERQLKAEFTNALVWVGENVCKFRAERKCLINCAGAMACNTEDLALVDNNGKPVGGKNA